MTIKQIIPIALLFLSADSYAQATVKRAPAIPKGDINKTDTKGMKDGMWLISQPARMGEPSFTEFGNYEHGDKAGLWYKLDGEGDLLAIETFRNNILDGEVKYYDRGRLNCLGYYRGLNPKQDFDTIFVLDPITHDEVRRIIPTEKGTLRHGTWRFYDTDNGRMVREEDYQVDEMVFAKDYPYTKADSIAIQKRDAKLPHNKRRFFELAPKQVSNTTEVKKN